jgi:SAM-dependent methyltransferase
MDRDTFAARQAAMTANWYEAVKRREGDVEAYIGRRKLAYLERWREAGRFIPDGSRVLDVGGGNLFAELLQYLRSKDLDYQYLDVDPGAVAGARQLGPLHGYDATRFSAGLNDRFDWPADSFDAVFSSHCIEHSIDLRSTFAELHRILRPGGNLLMAVPLGWEPNPEHPYFLAPEHWVALLEDHGFDVRVAQVGREYPEESVDLFIAARKARERSGALRIAPEDYRKESYTFVPHDDLAVHCRGQAIRDTTQARTHLRGEDWRIELRLPGVREAWPVLHRHDWSGIVQVRSGAATSCHDLYSWYAYVQPARHSAALAGGTLEITSAGRNACSFSTEAILHGFLVR